MKGETFKKYFLLTVIALGAGVIYKVAYMREAFYDAMLSGFQITNTQLGTISSIYGTVALISYLPGGILADKVSYKKLLTISFIGSGLLSLWCSTMPSFGMIKVIFGLMGVTTILTYWSAFVKTVRSLGNDEEQGRMFGLAEGIRGVSGIIASFIVMGIIQVAATEVGGMKGTLIFYGVIYIAGGIITMILLPNPKEVGTDRTFVMGDLIAAFKHKGTWLVCALVFCWYMVYCTTSYAIPYLTNVYGVSSVAISTLSIIRAYGIGIVAAPLAGFLGDKMKSCSKTLAYASIMGVALMAVYLVTPVKPEFLMVPVVLTLLFSFLVFAARGIYFSPMAEAGIPLALTGAASGLISVLGYAPDMFIFNIMGGWLDNLPGAQGYRYIFILAIVFLVLATAVGFYICRYGKSLKAQNK